MCVCVLYAYEMIFNMHTLLETAYSSSDVCLLSGFHILRVTKRKMCKKVVQRNHFVQMWEFTDYILLTFAKCDPT